MGYCTLYGDSCGAIAPIGDVYKTRLYELARWLNREKEMIPKGIIARAPSAELRPGQTDQDSLPPYEVLDDILSRHLEGGQSGAAIAKEGGHSPMTVAWVLSGYKKAAFKRDQEPFSLVVSKCPLGGFDWR
jgi:NAD+ synthetase